MAGKSIRVLIIDDSQDDALLLLGHLQRGGYAPHYRHVDSEEAFSSALMESAWDVILSDFSMGPFDGLRAIEIMLANGIDVPFIFVSGSIGEYRAAEAMRRGARGVFLKDNLAPLLPAIERELSADPARANARAAAPGASERVLRLASRNPADSAEGPPASGQDTAPDAMQPRELSARQREVLMLLVEGLSSKAAADRLGVSTKTVQAHRALLMKKLGIHTIVGLVRYAIRQELLRP